ncbi:cation channel sperm-associated auxiliary subunit epsilon [Cynocephalus volans]|uniref:cation channel sperm-associated auxiliary subunit epsilon n=1 Tax=Cynocephalus volans TaxID=110931 RepID=UPI002FC6F958
MAAPAARDTAVTIAAVRPKSLFCLNKVIVLGASTGTGIHLGIRATIAKSDSIKLEYEGTLFSEWDVPGTCSVQDRRSPTTELRCPSSGVYSIKPIVKGPDEEERYLSVESSNTCFLWNYRVINFVHNLTQVVIIWVYDPENANPDELLWQAEEPSLHSMTLSKQLAILGQKPTIYTLPNRKTYFSEDNTEMGTWQITIPMTNDVLKEVQGNQVAFQDCLIADVLFLLTFPLLTMPEIPGFLPLSSPTGSQLMAVQSACIPSSVVVVSDTETFQTNDSFYTWTRVRVPPNILSDDERRSVADVDLSWDGIFFLINGVLYVKTSLEFKRLGRDENVSDAGIIGITSRRWCWDKYLLKVTRNRSHIAIWTENEVYLGYTNLSFVKVVTTTEMRNHLNISSLDTLTIHNVEYTGHPLELAVLFSYCTTCTVTKTIYIVIYNEDTRQQVCQDFELDVPINSFLVPRFIFSAITELILWDKHRIYYYYHNFTDNGVIQTPTGHGNLSILSNDSIIHDVFMDYYGTMLIKMENNIIFFSKINTRDAVKLHLWANNTIKSLFFLHSSGQVYLLYAFDNGTVQRQDYPLSLEIQSIAFKTKDKCPYVAFHNNIARMFYFLDKTDTLKLWVQVVYPENIGLNIIVEQYGPKILVEKHQIHYEIAFGYCTKTMILSFSQNINYEAVKDYFKLQNQNTGLVLLNLRPSEYSKTCPTAKKVFQIAVGCDKNKFIAVKGFNKTECLHHDFSYVIEKSYLRHQPSKNLKVRYDWNAYGCPLKLDSMEKFQPVIQLFDDDGFIENVEANFIVWEIHGRNDYSFNNTMKQSGCLNEAQTWKSMTELNKHLPLGNAWGPENYKHCFSYAIGKPGDLNQPYEIINLSNGNHLFWPMGHSGMYIFCVKILDPNYSYCNLTAIFAIETFGVIPSPNVYLVASILFLLMLLFFSILVFSYFRYMKIYRRSIYEPLHKPPKTLKKN